MPGQITYSLMADWTGPMQPDPTDTIRQLASRLISCGVPSIFVDRDQGTDLTVYANLCSMILNRAIIPTVRIYPGDSGKSIQNLFEVCCLGIIKLGWTDGAPDFEWGKLFDTIDGAGRYRLPLDLVLNFIGVSPDAGTIADNLPRLLALSRKYGHIQVVKLDSETDAPNAIGADKMMLFREFLKTCPSAKAAISQKFWVESVQAGIVADDLGGIAINLTPSASDPATCIDGALTPLYLTPGIVFVPRLPLLISFYRKGWFSFEVGKALDSWVDKKAFKYYSERPGWL
jgi:hypothetical protein